MDALLVNGDEIELTPDPPWRWMAPPVKLKVSALPAHRIKAKGEYAIWESEILMAGLLGAGQMYAAPGFDTPGTVLTVTLTVNPGTMSATVKDMQQPVATVATTGTFVASVVPAMNPANGTPDPVVVKTGTWSVASQVQDVAKSGQPAQAQADGDSNGSGGGASDGASSAQDSAAEQKLHYVAVDLEDVDGNKLAQHRVNIGPPDGGWLPRTLTQAGSARVDSIVPEGEAIVQLLDAELHPPVKEPTKPWVAFTVIGEDGAPLEGAVLQIKTPDGQERIVKTGAKGAVRILLESEGDCEVLLVGMEDELRADSAPKDESPQGAEGTSEDENAPAGADGSNAETAADEVRVTLVDGQGQAIAGETVVVRRADGQEVRHTLDEEGTLLLRVEEGETLDVCFPNVPHAQVEE